MPKEIQHLYFPTSREPLLVDVPEMNYLMVGGSGDPNTSQEFHDAVEALYGLAYTIKFGARSPGIRHAPVMPLEGQFWTVRGKRMPPADRRDWRWTLMLRVPDLLGRDDFKAASRRLRERKNPAALGRVRLKRWKEGTAVETLYVGPYSGETTAIQALHEFARDNGYRLSGRHHEIYLSNPRRTRPERLKTVVRQPVSLARSAHDVAGRWRSAGRAAALPRKELSRAEPPGVQWGGRPGEP